MKNLLLTIIISLPLPAAAQSVPNGNFESWVSEQWAEAPEFWVTNNTEMHTPVTKDLESHEGAFAMRVTAKPHPVGLYGLASTLFEIEAIPEALNFYARWATEFGSVSVDIVFLNEGNPVYGESWHSASSMPEYNHISIPLEHIEPEITHARITVSALAGDFVPGTAWISVDAMDFGAPMGLHDAERVHIKLFPNPTQGVINIESGGGRIGSLSIYDVQGKRVHQSSINQQRAVINVEHLPKGQYIVVGEGDNGFTGKFVVE